MDYRYLGHSGLQVSTLSLGTMTFGGEGIFGDVGNTDVSEASRLIDVAIDHGVNLFDTANMYSDGRSEEILGEAPAGRRDDVLVSTKVFMPMGDGPNDGGLSRFHIIRQAEASLRCLQTDHIDLYQVHHWDGSTPLEETLEALDTLIRDGKVRYVGASNYAGWQLSKALSTADAHGFQRFVSHQIHYTLQAREAEYDLLPIGVDQGVGSLVWSPLAGGLLTGKYRRDQKPESGRQLTDWSEPPVRDEDTLYDIIDALVDIADSRGITAAQVGLAWTLGRPSVTSLVVGARTEKQLSDSLGAADVVLTQEERTRLDAISAPPVLYPFWQHINSAHNRLGDADILPREVLAARDTKN